uniref:Uncharacterized protein n=1 Tax=Guillardia theta TaxID=55529 RepID=A0A7S4P2W9_GUITH
MIRSLYFPLSPPLSDSFLQELQVHQSRQDESLQKYRMEIEDAASRVGSRVDHALTELRGDTTVLHRQMEEERNLNQQQLSDVRKTIQALQEEMNSNLRAEVDRSEEEERRRLQAIASRVQSLEEEVNGEEGVKYRIDMLAIRLDEQNVELVSEFQRQHALHLELVNDIKVELEKQQRRMEEGKEAAAAVFEQAREDMAAQRVEIEESVKKVGEQVGQVEEEVAKVKEMIGEVEGSLRTSQEEGLREVEEDMKQIRKVLEVTRTELEALAREEECRHVMEGMVSSLVVKEQEALLRFAIEDAKAVAAASVEELGRELLERRIPPLIKEEMQETVTLKLLPLSQDLREVEVNLSDHEVQAQNLREDVDRRVDVLSDRIELALANLQTTSSATVTAQEKMGELGGKLAQMAEEVKRAGQRSEDEAVRGKVDDLLMAVEMLHGQEGMRQELSLRVQALQASVDVLTKAVEPFEELRRSMQSSTEEVRSIKTRIEEVDKIVESLSEIVMDEGGKKGAEETSSEKDLDAASEGDELVDPSVSQLEPVMEEEEQAMDDEAKEGQAEEVLAAVQEEAAGEQGKASQEEVKEGREEGKEEEGKEKINQEEKALEGKEGTEPN